MSNRVVISAATKAKLATLLNVPNTKAWNVVDRVGDLFMIHPRFTLNEDEVNTLYHLRGVIVSMDEESGEGRVVCPSYGLDEIYTVDQVAEKDGKFSFGGSFTTPSAQIRITPSLDGVMLRFFLYKGKVYVSNYKKIDIVASKPHLINSRDFYTLYREAGGPKPEDFFIDGFKHSPWVHVVVVSHRELLDVSKVRYDKNGVVMYVGAFRAWSEDEVELPEVTSTRVDLKMTATIEDAEKHGLLYAPNSMSVTEINEFLIKGFHDYIADETLKGVAKEHLPGESVVVTFGKEDVGIPRAVRIHSPGYEYRYNLKKRQPNLKSRFIELIDAASNNRNLNLFRSQFPPIEVDNSEILTTMIESDVAFVFAKSSSFPDGYFRHFNNRLYQIWLNFLHAVPLHRQKECLSLIESYHSTVKNVEKWFGDLIRTRQTNKHGDNVAYFIDKVTSAHRHNKNGIENTIRQVVRTVGGVQLHRFDTLRKKDEYEKKKESSKPRVIPGNNPKPLLNNRKTVWKATK